MDRNTGFTLLEVLMALAIASVLAVGAAHALADGAAAARSAAERSALAETMLSSFNESSVVQKKVVVCASADGASCLGGIDWSAGWIAFVDLDEDRERSAGEPLLRVHPRLGQGVRLRGSVGRTRIVFQPFGGVNAGSNVTFTFCDDRGESRASTLVLANSGRLRSAPATSAQAAACLGPA